VEGGGEGGEGEVARGEGDPVEVVNYVGEPGRRERGRKRREEEEKEKEEKKKKKRRRKRGKKTGETESIHASSRQP